MEGMRGKDEAGIQIIPGVLSSKTGGKVCRGRSIEPCCQTAEIRLFSCSALRLQEVSPWIPRTMQSGSQRAAKICYELEAVIRGDADRRTGRGGMLCPLPQIRRRQQEPRGGSRQRSPAPEGAVLPAGDGCRGCALCMVDRQGPPRGRGWQKSLRCPSRDRCSQLSFHKMPF